MKSEDIITINIYNIDGKIIIAKDICEAVRVYGIYYNINEIQQIMLLQEGVIYKKNVLQES